MAYKLPFPDWTQATPAKLTLNAKGVSPSGGATPSVVWEGKVWFSEKRRKTITKDGKDVLLEGSLVIKGDIAPSMPEVVDGKAVVNGVEYDIYKVSRPRNPDSSIHHTTVELM